MAGSLQTAVLGMQAYQQMLNVTGNNIANADTVGFKESRITFADIFSLMDVKFLISAKRMVAEMFSPPSWIFPDSISCLAISTALGWVRLRHTLCLLRFRLLKTGD